MMLQLKRLLMLLVFLFPQLALAESVVVIVNEGNHQKISASDIKAIYTDRLIEWANGATIKSYDLPVKSAIRQQFSRKVLGISARDAAQDWANRKITNSAKNPPRTKKERFVVLSVKRDLNAVGYVSKGAIAGKSGIRVVMTID